MNSDIGSWLNNIGLGQYTSVFTQNDIDPDLVGDLTDQELKELGVSLGHRKRILRAAKTVRDVPDAIDAGAERRQLTVMFCDLVDSTGLSTRVDPEEVRRIISAYQQCCDRVVTRFGGQVARYMGDGVLVYFGYPIANEHDPERAIRTGLEITREVGQLKISADFVLKTRVGIATGKVIVGDLIGEGASQEHAVVGETPNLAARLQGLADPGTVVVSRRTRRLAGALFEYEDLGLHRLKGFDRAVPAWRVEREIDVESRFEATHGEGELTPLLGREAETAQLIERWSRTRDGHGQAALILGEPGIGKSHVSMALRARIADEAHTLVRYFCVPHQQKTALHPVVIQLERSCGIVRNDKPAARLQKIEMMVARFAGDTSNYVPVYAEFMGVPLDEHYEPLNLSPYMLKERMLDALLVQLKVLTEDKPVLVLFEDLHWIDPTSLELLERLLAQLTDLPLMLIMTARPEFVPPWQEMDNTVTLSIDRLADDDVARLIETVTQGKRLPAAVVKQIIDKTDGIPLFVEELTKTVLEAGVLEEMESEFVLKGVLPEIAVPSTLHDSLMARLDRLGAGKKVAQTGAAIGRSFSYELLARVSPFETGKLAQALDDLVSSGLVLQTREGQNAGYLFKHALIQDAAYSTLLSDSRRELHEAIAKALELYYPQTVQQQPQILAHHYTLAGEIAKGISFRERAARKAVERGTETEAQEHIVRALNLLTELPDDPARLQLELGLRVIQGVVLESTLGYAASEVEESYDRARVICEQLDQKSELVPVLLGLYVFNLVRGEYLRAKALAQRCVSLSKEANNLDCLIESYAALGYVQGHLGEFQASINTLQDCISLYEAHSEREQFRNITAQDPCVSSLSMLPIVLWLCGDVEASEQIMNKAFVLCDRLSRPINHALAHTHAAEYYFMRREYERALWHAKKGIDYSAEHGYVSWRLCSLVHAGVAKVKLATKDSQVDSGINMAQQALHTLGAAGARSNAAYFKGRTAWCLHVTGRFEDAQTLLRAAFEDCEQSKDYLQVSMLYLVRGEMSLSGPHPDTAAAEKDFVKAVEFARQLGAKTAELQALLSLGKLLLQTGRGATTLAGLGEAVRWFPVTCNVPDLVEARELLQNFHGVSVPAG